MVEKTNEKILETYKRINVVIENIPGAPGLLMHNIENAELQKSARIKTKKYDIKEEAEIAAYWMEIKGVRKLCLPSRCIYRMILSGGKPYKIGRTSLSTLMAGVIRIEPDRIPFLDNNGLTTDKYEIDVQVVVIQNSRIMRARPRLDKWKLAFDIVYHSEYMNFESIKNALVSAGFSIGLCDFRPERKGIYGTFQMTKFEET